MMIVEDPACGEDIRSSALEAHQPTAAEGFAVGVPQAECGSGGIYGRYNLLLSQRLSGIIPAFFHKSIVSCNSPSLFHERRNR